MPKPSAQRRAWQLPRGVSSGTWDYVAEPTIATEYDTYHGEHPLMKLDVELVDRQLDRLLANRPRDPFLLADFGCGTARIARHAQVRGIRTLNIDLSLHMLAEVSKSLSTQPKQHAQVHSNLVELDWLADRSIDLSVCLFSSIGMIRGRTNRVCFLKHVARTLKPEGLFLLHVHNRGHSWLDPMGPRWLLSGLIRSWTATNWEIGDRVYVYRGLPQMFLHIYSRRELIQDLKAAGFGSTEIMPVNLVGDTLMKPSAMAQYFRAGGYFALAQGGTGMASA